MRNFAYVRAATPEGAINATTAGAAILAGGTEFLNWLRLGIADPERVVDIGRLGALRRIARDGDLMRIGALATFNEIGESELIRIVARSSLRPVSGRHPPSSATAPHSAAMSCRRHAAPIFGPRRQTSQPCPGRATSALRWIRLRRPGQRLYRGPCSAGPRIVSPPTRPIPAVALAALDGVVEVAGRDGSRSIAMTDFHLTPEEAMEPGRVRDLRTA